MGILRSVKFQDTKQKRRRAGAGVKQGRNRALAALQTPDALMDMAIALAILSTLAGLGASLLMTVLLFASAPNSSAAQWAQIRNWLIAIAVVALLGLAGSGWLLIVKKPWYACGVGGFPVLFSLVALIVIWNTQKP